MICMLEDTILSSVFNVPHFSDSRYCVFIAFSDFIFSTNVIYEPKTYVGRLVILETSLEMVQCKFCLGEDL